MRLWTVLVFAGYVFMGHQYAKVWASNEALWGHAQRQAPKKLRPFLNYTKAIYTARP